MPRKADRIDYQLLDGDVAQGSNITIFYGR